MAHIPGTRKQKARTWSSEFFKLYHELRVQFLVKECTTSISLMTLELYCVRLFIIVPFHSYFHHCFEDSLW